MLISVEGGDGAGKTTLVRRLAEHWRSAGIDVCATLEPGGTSFGSHLRQAILHSEQRIGVWAETFLFLADRADDIEKVIRPALELGRLVLCDRFADSTLAYQGYGHGLDLDLLRRLNAEATGGREADLTLLLDLPPEQGLARGRLDGGDWIANAAFEFHRKVNAGFREIAAQAPQRVVRLDASQPAVQVFEQAIATAEPRLLGAGLLTPERSTAWVGGCPVRSVTARIDANDACGRSTYTHTQFGHSPVQ